MNKVDKILESYQHQGQSKSVRAQQMLFSIKSEENNEGPVEYTNIDVTHQFNKDRIAVALNLKKKELLSSLTANFKNTLMKNFEKQKDFRCYEKSKRPFMTEFLKQSDIINKIGTRKLTS